MQTLTVSQAKATLNALVDQVAETWEPVMLTRHGKPLAVVQSAEDFEAAQETMAWLADPATLPAIREADAEAAAGAPGASVEQVRRELGLDV
jgi:prevent-host-death family protein